MFDPNQPARNTLAPYQPRPAEAQRVDDFSFRFGEGESLKGVWSVVRKRKIGIAVAGGLGLALALAACAAMSRQYLATSTIEVGKSDASQTSLRLNAIVATPSSDEMKTDIATHIKVLQSPAVLLSVVRDLKLQQEAPFAFKPSLMGAINGSTRRSKTRSNGASTEDAPYSRDRILAIFDRS
jgi:uncharacterized protein involved in exopolysaccharide biosynthesis